MAEIHEIYNLKLSDGKCVKAHICKSLGHVLFVPLCHMIATGSGQGPMAERARSSEEFRR